MAQFTIQTALVMSVIGGISQARWVTAGCGRSVLVLTGHGGVLVYDWDGGLLIRVGGAAHQDGETP